MPAYFMQYIAYCMHGGLTAFGIDGSDIGFYKADFTKKYIQTKETLIVNKKYINFPHFLESYYLILKTISSISFK